jgi:hypothetical protein
MIFLNEEDKRVILSARKCGLMSLSHSVTSLFKNKSENKSYNIGNLDPHLYFNDRSDTKVFEKTYWHDYDVTLIIREPYERYISGLRTLWHLKWLAHKELPFKEWFEYCYTRTNSIDLHNGHCSNWLYQTEDISCKSLEIVDTSNLGNWLSDNGFEPIHTHKSSKKDLYIINEYIEQHILGEVNLYLSNEFEQYNRLTLLSKGSKITA